MIIQIDGKEWKKVDEILVLDISEAQPIQKIVVVPGKLINLITEPTEVKVIAALGE